jgi:hypothetical protein
MVDLFTSATGTLAWAYAAPTAKSLTDLAAEQNASDASIATCPSTPEIDQPTFIEGDPARLTMRHCPESDGMLLATAVVIHGTTGYGFALEHPTTVAAATDDLEVFKILLRGVEFFP